MRIGLLYGGHSPEYEISLRSAQTILQHFNPSKFTLIPIHITRESEWVIFDNTLFTSSSNQYSPKTYKTIPSQLPCDVIFSVLHGHLGEDGAMQGLFNILDIPYVGSDILGSALGMNKVIAKQLVTLNQVACVVPYWDFKLYQWEQNALYCLQSIEKRLHYPLFVKPVNAGSSIGVSRVQSRSELEYAIDHAFQYDTHIMIEKAVQADEIEVAVLESVHYGEPPLVSTVGSITMQDAFYSYEAKYENKQSARLQIPAVLSEEQMNKVRVQARHIFEVLQCSGMARIDFFLEKNTHQIYFNELNTLPGFTEISMYPQLWKASGKPLSELLEHLIQVALARHKRALKLKRLR